jgi:hypothetical protein
MVWAPPKSRDSGGLSAVTAIIGTRATFASAIAGRRLAAAVPEVQTIATGVDELLDIPSAKNAADLSS